MEYIRWKEELSVDNHLIDSQHKELFRLINAFYNSFADNSGKPAILQAICDMEKYAMEHFAEEENMMQRANYFGRQSHINEHQEFIKAVSDFRQRYEEGRLLLSLEVTGFVKNWITKHIMKTDQLYKGKI